jgi:hypothetical protein
MATYAEPPIRIDGRRIAGLIAQTGSFATTWAFIAALKMPPLIGFGVALAVEIILYYGKKLAFERGADSIGWVAVVLDTLLNAGGLWPITKQFSATPTWIMLAESLGLEVQMSALAALILALVLGFILSALPHRLLSN